METELLIWPERLAIPSYKFVKAIHVKNA